MNKDYKVGLLKNKMYIVSIILIISQTADKLNEINTKNNINMMNLYQKKNKNT